MSTSTTANGSSPNAENDANNNANAQKSPQKTSRWNTQESQDQDGRCIPRFIFDPDGNVVCYWTAVVALVTLYNAWTIALRIAFPEIRHEDFPSCLPFLDVVSDLIYLFDILVQLRTAYLLDGIPVFEPVKIRQQYMSQTYFIQDVISVLPSQTILSFMPDAVGCCKYFLCTAGAARLTKLFKFHILYKFYDLAESLTSNPHLIRVLRLFLNLAIIIHWIACLYYLLSEYEGLGSNAWVYTNSTDQQRFSRKYIICLYWSAMTLTTIGNTNPPETDVEYIFTGLIFMTGVFVFATVMGNVGDVISSMNANRQEFQARMDHIQMYLTHKKVPASLQLKIKKWAEYTWSRTKATDESRLLNMLPERLRAEVAVHVHLDSLKKVKIFEQCETGFLCELVLKLRSQVYSPGDYVCRVGETGREMFIINHGKVEVIVSNPATNQPMVVAVLSEGNYFGEISLLRLDGVQNRRTADVRSIGYSELLCLSRRDLMSALVEYPEAKSVLEDQAKKRMKTNLQAQRAFSVDVLLRNSHDHSSTDSGLGGRDDPRGHEVSEIKAMIEELKNANKVPGRTVWQLIARCEVLQAKLGEKEKEVEDSKLRIRDLEHLLFSCVRQPCETPPLPENPGKLLKPGVRVTKQFSQDEGGQEPLNDVIPQVRVTRSPTEDDTYIKTSKITNIYESGENISSPVNELINPDFRTQKERDAAEHVVEAFKDRKVDSGIKFTQSIWNTRSSFDLCLSNETIIDHQMLLDDDQELTFSTSYREEFLISDAYSLDVPTIPEESEEDMLHYSSNADPSTLGAVQGKRKRCLLAKMPRTSSADLLCGESGFEEVGAMPSADDISLNEPPELLPSEYKQETDCSVQCQNRQSVNGGTVLSGNGDASPMRLDDANASVVVRPSVPKGIRRLQLVSGTRPFDSLDSCEDVDFRKLGALTRSFSGDSRKDSWAWESDCESEDDAST